MTCELLQGDSREILRTLSGDSVHCCVTSPPYWGLRDYGVPGQLGLERTPEDYVEKLRNIFKEVFRVLRPDGTLWLNLGDSYATGAGSARIAGGKKFGKANKIIDDGAYPVSQPNRAKLEGLKPKDLIGIPWRVAFALQRDGWFLRSDIIWNKPNIKPESVTDRPTKSHEYIFLLSKSRRYFYDRFAIQEDATTWREAKYDNGLNGHAGGYSNQGEGSSTRKFAADPSKRNRRTVWTVSTKPFRDAHFATFPPDLIRPCVLAGSPAGGIVLDPFAGAGTTNLVARDLGRSSIGIELNPDYIEIAAKRLGVPIPETTVKRIQKEGVRQGDLWLGFI